MVCISLPTYSSETLAAKWTLSYPLFRLPWGPKLSMPRWPEAQSPAWRGHTVLPPPDLGDQLMGRPFCPSHAVSSGEMNHVLIGEFVPLLSKSEQSQFHGELLSELLRAVLLTVIIALGPKCRVSWSARLSRALSFPPFPGSHLKQRNVLTALARLLPAPWLSSSPSS